MPATLRYLCLLCSLALLSCRDDFSLQAEFTDVPVIYGYVNPSDPVQYFRVERSVPGGDAGAGARDPGQLFYGSGAATVTLTNSSTGVSAELERIDGRDVGIFRQAGDFANEPNILYRLPSQTLPLQPGQEIELRVSRPDAEDAVATTKLLERISVIRPSAQVRLDDYRRPAVIGWTSGPDAAVFAVELHFAVEEFYGSDPSRDRTVPLTYTAAEAFVPEAGDRNGDQTLYELDNEAVFRFLGESLPASDDVTRRLTTVDVVVTGVGEEVARLLTLRNANAGLTGSQPPPTFSNVLNGQGLLTGRSVDERTDVRLDEGSLDSLREGRYTRPLNFR